MKKNMRYARPTNTRSISKTEKLSLVREYFDHYNRLAAGDLSALNRKVPRAAFSDLVDEIGSRLLLQSERLANEPGVVRDFVLANPLPESMETLLPEQFRVFCLALNALKQWVSAEQKATDRYLLGSKARELCKAAATKCLITGDAFDGDIELHHPVRDGRPPLPLSRKAHSRLEKQVSGESTEAVDRALLPIKRKGNHSWAQLRRGCEDLLGLPNQTGGSKNVAANARSFARNAVKETGLQYSDILDWLDKRGT